MYIYSMTKGEFIALIKSTMQDALHKGRAELKSLFPAPDSCEYCTIQLVCEKFKVTKATVHNWAKKGTIKKYRINGRVLYKLAEIENSFNLNCQS